MPDAVSIGGRLIFNEQVLRIFLRKQVAYIRRIYAVTVICEDFSQDINHCLLIHSYYTSHPTEILYLFEKTNDDFGNYLSRIVIIRIKMTDIMFIISRIESMMYEVTFDPLQRKGIIIANISIVDEADFKKVLDLIRQAVHSGLSVSPYIKIIRPGEKVGNLKIEKGKTGIATACSITIDGVLLKSGVPVKPKFGGVVEIHDGSPLRFTDILTYESTTIDPLDVLMSQELTSVTEMVNTGSGKILANLREAPMAARDRIEQVLDSLVEAGFSCILEVGEPNSDILGVQVGRDKLGIAVIGGTNPMALVQEHGIDINTQEMSILLDIGEMAHIDEVK